MRQEKLKNLEKYGTKLGRSSKTLAAESNSDQLAQSAIKKKTEKPKLRPGALSISVASNKLYSKQHFNNNIHIIIRFNRIQSVNGGWQQRRLLPSFETRRCWRRMRLSTEWICIAGFKICPTMWSLSMFSSRHIDGIRYSYLFVRMVLPVLVQLRFFLPALSSTRWSVISFVILAWWSLWLKWLVLSWLMVEVTAYFRVKGSINQIKYIHCQSTTFKNRHATGFI